MKYKIFTIYDSKAKAHLPPFFLPEQGMAIRVFTDCVNDPTHNFHNHPGDYTLLQIGLWDDNSAVITTNSTPSPLGNGLSFIKTDITLDKTPFEEHVEAEGLEIKDN
nr:MAG: nonstructural protein [Microvirus sp.]